MKTDRNQDSTFQRGGRQEAAIKTAEDHRKDCMLRQSELRGLLTEADVQPNSMALFLDQHASLHSANMSRSVAWSFPDDVLQGLAEQELRSIPDSHEHSIAWLLWHIARCEDITMNLLVAGTPQVLLAGNWPQKMKITSVDSGNGMNPEAISLFSEKVDIPALLDYRLSVGQRTSAIVMALDTGRLPERMDPARVQRMWDEGAVNSETQEIGEYWASRTVAGLLLMPASRHILVHLNEALAVRHKLRSSKR